MYMDIYLKTPGSTLIGLDRITFDDIKVAVDKATNEFLLRPDWDANLRCVELIKPLNNLDILNEVTLLLRKKLRASQQKIVVLTLRLMEALTTNCGRMWFYALNAEPVTHEIANVARKYVNKTGVENKEVSDTCLDVVQAWGEAFLTRKKEYPNIVDLYFTLRKEGLPFKVNNQFDPSRVPIFEGPGASGGRKGNDVFLDAQTDSILAATLQASMEINAPEPARRMSGTSAPAMGPGRSNSLRGASRTSKTGVEDISHVIESMSVSLQILKDLILASNTIFELKSNDVVNEIIDQIRSYQTQIHVLIEATMNNPELLADLFKYNDYSQTLFSICADIKDGSLSLSEGKTVVNSVLTFDDATPADSKSGAVAVAPPSNTATTTTNLLDYDEPPVTTANSVPNHPPVPASTATSTSGAIDLDFFSMPSAMTTGTQTATKAAPQVTSQPLTATNKPAETVADISVPAPVSKQSSGTIPRLAPPPSGKVPFLAPPPKAGSAVRHHSINETTRSDTVPAPPTASTVTHQQPAHSAASELLDLFSLEPVPPAAKPAATVTTTAPQPQHQPFAAFPPPPQPAMGMSSHPSIGQHQISSGVHPSLPSAPGFMQPPVTKPAYNPYNPQSIPFNHPQAYPQPSVPVNHPVPSTLPSTQRPSTNTTNNNSASNDNPFDLFN